LRQHHTKQAARRLRAGETWQDRDLVFCARNGKPLAAGNVRRAFRSITKAAGVGEDWTPRELRRWLEGGPYPVPAPADLAEAFRWSEHRTVSKTALVSLHGNRYQVGPTLVGRKVELVFGPFDLTFLRVRLDGTDAGTALPFQITRHSHPKAKPEVPAEPPKPATGIDYLALIDATHTAELAGKVNYSALGWDPPAAGHTGAGGDQRDADQEQP
jgi:hypothetical protein